MSFTMPTTQSSHVIQELEPPPVSDSGMETRAEIDTSAPFESVKEAAHRFGGIGFWRPPPPLSRNSHQRHGDGEITGIVAVEEQAEQLERDLIAKEKETLDVLTDLENIKNAVQHLKLRLPRQGPGINVILQQTPQDSCTFNQDGFSGFILQELQQAKLNLSRTTNDLANIRTTLDLYKKRIERGMTLLENTHRRLSSNISKNKTEPKMQEGSTEDIGSQGFRDPIDISKELQQLSSETVEFKKVGEAAKSKVLRAISEIEQTKIRVRNAEIRLVAAKRMKEAAKASEAVARAEIKAFSEGETKVTKAQKISDVTLTFDEYSCLISKAREAEKARTGSIVDEEYLSNAEILKRVVEATEEVKTSKKALEEVLNRVEAATRGKLEVEDALHKQRSKHGHKRPSAHNSNRFKNSHHASTPWKEPCLLDVTSSNPANDKPKLVLKPTLSIGQILSRKLQLTEEYEKGNQTDNIMTKHRVSLSQMLGRRSTDSHPSKKSGKENCELPMKQNKFGIGRLPLLKAKQSKKEKNNCITKQVGVSSTVLA